MAIYRSDQATVTFGAEVAQGAYQEAGDIAEYSSTGLGISTAVSAGDRTIALTGTFAPGGGANLKTFIIVGNNTKETGPKEIRRVVSGYNSTTITVDVPFGFRHPAVAAGNNIIESLNMADDDTDIAYTDDKGKFITWLPGVYESVDCPDPEQAFEPRYILGNLTNRNFYQMYAGQESLTGSIGGMVMLNGFPLRFPVGKVVTTPVAVTSDSGWDLSADVKAGDTLIPVARTGNLAITAGEYYLFGVPNGGNRPSGSTHITDSTQVYEIRQAVTTNASAASGTMQIWPPLSFDHSVDDDLYSVPVSNTSEFLHTIFEQVKLDSMTWNVNILDDEGSNAWQRRYIGGKVGSMTLSAEAGGLLTGGWDGVNFLDMVHNVKSHASLPANQPVPRYTLMQDISSTKVGKYNSTGTFDRPTTSPYYFSQGIVKMFDAASASGTEVARLNSMSLSVSNNTEPRYYVGAQYDGRRSPKEQFEGQREYSMSASLAIEDAANQKTTTSTTLFKELLLAGDYRGAGATGITQGFRGFGIQLQFVRDIDGDQNDYIKIDIPKDGTASTGGNEQGAFIRSAPHNVGDTNPLTVDADIAFRDMKITIRDKEPIYP